MIVQLHYLKTKHGNSYFIVGGDEVGKSGSSPREARGNWKKGLRSNKWKKNVLK